MLGLLREGDRGTLRVIEDAGDAIGLVLAPAVLLLNPEIIVIGGELASVGEALFQPLRRALARGIMSSHARAADRAKRPRRQRRRARRRRSRP